MPLGVLALKVSEGRGDHVGQIFSHEEHDIVDFFILGTPWNTVYVFANMLYALLALYWLYHGTTKFSIYGTFYVSCLFFVLFILLNVVLLRSKSAFLQIIIGEFFIVLGPPVSVYAPSLTVPCLHVSRPHPESPLFKVFHTFYRKYLYKTMVIPYNNKQN